MKAIDAIRNLSLPQAIALAAIALSSALVAVFAPPHFWERFASADWPHIVGVVGLIASAVAGVFTAPRLP
jgi:uncharacterized membrane protein